MQSKIIFSMKAVVAMIVVLSFDTATAASTAVQTTVPLYGQCGGINWTGGTTCALGSTCQFQNPYYSQCLPSSSSSTTTIPLYGQCGGIGWTASPATTCTLGSTCQFLNPYYSQCLPPPPSSPSSASLTAASTITSSAKKTTTIITTTTTTSAKSKSIVAISVTTSPGKSVSSSSSTISTSTSTNSNPSGSPKPVTGSIYKASITHYGAGDTFGSPNCNTNTAACGFYTYPGYSAAVSQNFFGVGPGAGAGPACGTCWKLTGQTDSSGHPLTNAGTSIIVMVNNLCPADGNPLCTQNGMTGTNQYGANVNFDLCSDSGAQAAFFGNDGVGLAVGTATQVDCKLWSGTVVH